MPVLDSGLETIEYGTQGWSAIVTSNAQLLDEKLKHVMTANEILGTRAVTNITTSQADPAPQNSASLTDNSGGTPSTTIKTISGSGADTDINDNFASLTDQHNKVVNEIADLIAVLMGAIDYSNDIKVKVNEILERLRKSTGNGVFSA